MARQATAQIRLQVTGGQATPAPPVGPALGQHGVNIGAFVTQFNDRTKEMRGITVPAWGHSGQPSLTASFRYELIKQSDGSVVDAGTISGTDSFTGQGCDV